ncbi:hypothetical protein F2Q69_00006736 [Brassica cretica]|uniref:Uncharacterized protein n=1 Tax=Brassica cretica TaxID=69181 RepID=A0A8S9PFL9_BRACR|nr:hypothetical protein F2Q69_00006736 [Brassica cretica]
MEAPSSLVGNVIMDQPADEDVLAIPDDPMTRSRTRRLNEAVGSLLKLSWKQEEKLRVSTSVCHIRSSHLGVSRDHSAASCITHRSTALINLSLRFVYARIYPYHPEKHPRSSLSGIKFESICLSVVKI